MATEKQIQANRANATRSTGPVTEEGKKASSQNARCHDQLSSCIVLKAECTPEFDQLMDSLIDEFQPSTANETALIETMAVARWKLWRNWIYHSALLEVEITKQDPEVGSEPVIAALAFKALADSSHSLQLLHRYETSLDRQYSRALNNLLKGRAAAGTQSATPAEPEVIPAPATECPAKLPNEPNSPPAPAASSPQNPASGRNESRPVAKPAPITSITSRAPLAPVAKPPHTPPKR